MTTTALERQVEKIFCRLVEEAGGLTIKFNSPARIGVPDQIVIYHGAIYFVELKRADTELRPSQRIVQRKMIAHGANVYTLHGLQEVESWVAMLKEGGL